jgi:alpha-tubulin suppressor-like RCC1 family protein
MKLVWKMLLSLTVLHIHGLHAATQPAGWVIGWGDNHSGAATGVAQYHEYSTGAVETAGLVVESITAVAVGGSHSLALRSDGKVVGWGFNRSGQATGVSLVDHENASGLVRISGKELAEVIAIAAGSTHSLALKTDGTVVAWGAEDFGKTHVPSNLTNVVAIASGWQHSLALKKDGTVVSWGDQASVPAGLSNVIALVAGPAPDAANLALKSNGTVVDWFARRIDSGVPAGLSNVIAIASGTEHCLAVTRDGSVVAWGVDRFGETDVPRGLTNVLSVAAGSHLSLALRNDGTVVAWGGDRFHPATVPSGLSNVVAIAAGPDFRLAITTNSAVADRFRR